jgi:hypothetical protein
VITGTPISQQLDEVRGLLEFLDLQPFYTPQQWKALLMAPFNARAAAGLRAMRTLLQVRPPARAMPSAQRPPSTWGSPPDPAGPSWLPSCLALKLPAGPGPGRSIAPCSASSCAAAGSLRPPPPSPGARACLQGVMLRRSKAQVETQLLLPPCTRQNLPVVLGRVERTFYNAVLLQYREAVQVGASQGARGCRQRRGRCRRWRRWGARCGVVC